MQKLSPLAVGINLNIKAELARRDKSDSLVMTATGLKVDALRRRKRADTAWTVDEIDAVAELLEINSSVLTTVDRAAIMREFFPERLEAGSTPA